MHGRAACTDRDEAHVVSAAGGGRVPVAATQNVYVSMYVCMYVSSVHSLFAGHQLDGADVELPVVCGRGDGFDGGAVQTVLREIKKTRESETSISTNTNTKAIRTQSRSRPSEHATATVSPWITSAQQMLPAPAPAPAAALGVEWMISAAEITPTLLMTDDKECTERFGGVGDLTSWRQPQLPLPLPGAAPGRRR